MPLIILFLLPFLPMVLFGVIARKPARNKSKNSFENDRTPPPHVDPDKCNGNCNNCPPHYGYRYGRWYYGHGHQHGCQRHGNGGATGRTTRD